MANEGKFNEWGVLPCGDTKEEEFMFAIRNTSPEQGQPFMRDFGPMSEEEIRKQLDKINVSKADADVAIARARAAKRAEK